mmetsp:Transcript_6870/g.13174  ORF Transcript_6870/g.13174 Transcript_6870/m.13174 type:complete len:212 (+) Transcript_6870:115-750(+)
MKQQDRDYGSHVSALTTLLNQDKINLTPIEKELDAIIAIKKSYTNDLRLESNRVTRAKFESKLATRDEEVRSLLSSSPPAVKSSPKAKVLHDLIERSTLYSHLDGKGNDELITGAKELQQKTLDSIAQSKMMVYASTEVGEKTLTELQHQRLQVERIEENVNEIDSKLGRAATLVADYKTRISRDTFCRMMTVINCLLIVLVIAFLVLSRD